SFDFRVIEYCRKEVLIEREQCHIDYGCEYNVCIIAGNRLGTKHSKKARQKMSKIQKELWKDPERRKKMSETKKELWKDSERRKKFSEMRKERAKDRTSYMIENQSGERLTGIQSELKE